MKDKHNLILFINIFYKIQPQISVPDVIIWMLSDNTRVAYARIPAHKLMFSEDSMCCGELCGKIQTIILEVGLTKIGNPEATYSHTVSATPA